MNAEATISGRANGPQNMPHAMHLNPTKVGMLAFLLSEIAFFSTLITTYIVFLKATTESNPSPAEVFPSMELVIASTTCLLSSSLTIHWAGSAFRRANREAFLALWGLTILLGITFIVCTGVEWHGLIFGDNMTISRNLFGSTYFTLVGFHAAHVTVGLIVLSIVWLLGLRKKLTQHNSAGVEVVSWYWHFVDAVWVVVFSLVYLISTSREKWLLLFGPVVAILTFFLVRSEKHAISETTL